MARGRRAGSGAALLGARCAVALASGAAGRAGGKEAHKQTQCVSTGQRLIATANLVGKSGSPLLGNALFEQRDGRVQIRVQLQQAPAGRHGVFVYESGDCAGARAENTSAVFNPTRAPAGGPGRIGDIEVGRDGNGELEVQSEQLTVQAGPLSVLFRALVIHAQPAEPLAETPAPGSPRGERATRIGCGVITMRPELLAP